MQPTCKKGNGIIISQLWRSSPELQDIVAAPAIDSSDRQQGACMLISGSKGNDFCRGETMNLTAIVAAKALNKVLTLPRANVLTLL